MKMKKKENIVIIVILVVMLIAIIGVSWAAFNFSKQGNTPNKITTGYITMSYTESDNTINLGNALPTTDNTGVRRLKDGEYFDFEVTTDIKGNSYVNYEISAKEVGKGTIDGSNIKLYLSRVNEDGTETSVTKGVNVYSSSIIGTVPTYKEEVMANSITGRPAGEMSLLTGTTSSQGEVTTKYRLRMYVAEEYNPQGDGGGLSFAIKVNVYGKNEAMTGPVLKPYIDEPARTNVVDLPQTDFHTDEYKENITSIVTKNDTTIPEVVIESWDMSVAEDGSVVAYIEDDGTGSGTYKLTIGGNGKIIANPNMSWYFTDFLKLETIDLSYLDTSIVNNMRGLFGWNYSLTELNVDDLDTENVTDMSNMFSNCSSLTELNLSNFDTSNVTDMAGMFNDCSSLTELNVDDLDTENVTDMSNMFSNCSSLTELNLSNLDTSNVTNMSYMFSDCSSLTELNVDDLDTENVTDMNNMFYNCSSLTELDVSSFNTKHVTDMQWMFGASQFSDTPYMSLKKITFGNNFTTSNVTNMSGMFLNCSSLTELDLSNFDTSNVNRMNSMFSNCSSLNSLDLRNFNTSKVTNMYGMFESTTNLREVLVDETKWIINNNTNIINMFRNSGVSSVTYI